MYIYIYIYLLKVYRLYNINEILTLKIKLNETKLIMGVISYIL